MEFSFTDLIELIQDALDKIYPGEVPESVSLIIAWVVLGLSVIFIVYITLWLLLKIVGLIRQELIPLFYNAEKQRIRKRRQQFADHIESEIRRLNGLEEWSDYRFTELEAEVEAEGTRSSSWLPFVTRQDRLRREPSLSQALSRSKERLILIEGVPGSGKSVALRHVALDLARRAVKARAVDTIIPIYVNLKSLRRDPEVESNRINGRLIERYVIQSINRANNRDVEEFLDENFRAGLQGGTWIFLFDSFDEIPEILSATDTSDLVTEYAEAISDFLHGMNRCRGILASREYRGPNLLGWPRFRILSLSEERQHKLIRNFDLAEDLETQVIGRLHNASASLRGMSGNPMFLSLLCDYVRVQKQFPQHEYSAYEEYIQSRFTRDGDRVMRRYGIESNKIRNVAESIAFCMAIDGSLSLNPLREEIGSALERQNFPLNHDLNIYLDALEFMKIGRSEIQTIGSQSRPFSFAHRRIQEYFATKIVLREPHRVDVDKLLNDGVWRETCVVFLQTQEPIHLTNILEKAADLLKQHVENLKELISLSAMEGGVIVDSPKPLTWPPGLLHLLSILHDGLSNRMQIVNFEIQQLYSQIYNVVWQPERWLEVDLLWGLEVSALLPQNDLDRVLKDAFKHKSPKIRRAAYRQVAFLKELSPDHTKAVLRTLVELSEAGNLNKEREATKAHVLSFTNPQPFLNAFRFLQSVPIVNSSLLILTTVLLSLIFGEGLSTQSLALRTCLNVVLIVVIKKLLSEDNLSLILTNERSRSKTSHNRLFSTPIALNAIYIYFAFIFSFSLVLRPTSVMNPIEPLFFESIKEINSIEELTSTVSTLLTPTNIIAAIILIVAILWQPSVHIVVRRGQYLRPYLWPLGILFAVPSAFANIRIVFLLLLYVIICVVGIVAIAINNPVFNTISNIALILIFLFAILFLYISTANKKGFNPFGWISKYKTDRKLLDSLNSNHESISSEQFLDYLTLFTYDNSRINYLTQVARYSLIRGTDRDVELLESLASLIQRDLRRYADGKELLFKDVILHSDNSFIEQWYSEFVIKNRSYKNRFDPEYGLTVLGRNFLEILNSYLGEMRRKKYKGLS